MHQADWIAPRLTSWEDGKITMVAPAGFEAYARVLHPAATPEHGDRLVRWAEVAAWSGMPLRSDAQFHSIALPPTAPGGPPPYDSQGPLEGVLYLPDAEVLAAIGRNWTATPEDCWFCVWDGFGWEAAGTVAVLTEAGQPGEIIEEPRPDPVPGPVREGPRVHLPYRDYFLYSGRAEAVVTLADLDGTSGQCPNIWWPADRAWCVASEIDLQWTYVGGSRGLIDAILADDRIEALPTAPDDRVGRVEDWVIAWADQLVDGLMARGAASLNTPRGSVDAWLRRPRGIRQGELRIEVTGPSGSGSSVRSGLRGDDGELRREVHDYVTFAVLDLTGMLFRRRRRLTGPRAPEGEARRGPCRPGVWRHARQTAGACARSWGGGGEPERAAAPAGSSTAGQG